jgi:glycosyltransferase involved in cell wall biosynthesis
MRIAYLAPNYLPHMGGVETHIAHLAARMLAQHHDVEVLTPVTDVRLPAVQLMDGITVRRFACHCVCSPNYLFPPALWTFLARCGMRYDVVHAHSYHSLPALGAAIARCWPLVFTPHYHGTGHTPVARLLHLVYRPAGSFIFKQAQRVICVSQAEAALVRQRFPFVATRISVIPNGVDVAALRAALPYRQRHTIILSVGRLESYKNVHLIVEALSHLDEAFLLRIIGDGPARSTLEALVARLGLSHRVEILGNVENTTLHRWFRTAAVYVTMSSREAFGITLLEAVVAGARAVASDIPPYREVALACADRAVSLLALSATPAALAEVIRTAALSRCAVSATTPALSWDAVADQTLAIYRALTCHGGRQCSR